MTARARRLDDEGGGHAVGRFAQRIARRAASVLLVRSQEDAHGGDPSCDRRSAATITTRHAFMS